MKWKQIRLELARTNEFPTGSASRAYLVQLPVNEEGLIDEEVLKATPQRARVRRHWPNEPDMSGYVIRTPKRCAVSRNERSSLWRFGWFSSEGIVGPALLVAPMQRFYLHFVVTLSGAGTIPLWRLR